jgi:hypothetical protein
MESISNVSQASSLFMNKGNIDLAVEKLIKQTASEVQYASEELKLKMGDMEQNNKIKTELSKELTKVNEQLKKEPKKYSCIPNASLKNNWDGEYTYAGKTLTKKKQLEQYSTALKGQLDLRNTGTELQMLDLRRSLNARNESIQFLSKIMSTDHQTCMAVINNM